MKNFKTDYRHVLLALRADIKTFGGFGKAAERTVAALASLVDQITLDQHDDNLTTECEIKAFLALVKNASELLGKGSEFAMDQRFDAHEREQLLPMLLSLQQVAGQLYRKLNK